MFIKGIKYSFRLNPCLLFSFLFNFFALEFINIQMAGRASLFENLFRTSVAQEFMVLPKGLEVRH